MGRLGNEILREIDPPEYAPANTKCGADAVCPQPAPSPHVTTRGRHLTPPARRPPTGSRCPLGAAREEAAAPELGPDPNHAAMASERMRAAAKADRAAAQAEAAQAAAQRSAAQQVTPKLLWLGGELVTLWGI